MSIYLLPPSPERGAEFAYWENNFTDEEITKLREQLDALPTENGWVGEGKYDEKIRRTQVAWMNLTPESQWVYDRFGFIARQLNAMYFNLDLFGFSEDFQYAVYNPDGSHYEWHIDKGSRTPAPRKLSMVMQLSDPSEYEGGDLQFLIGPEPDVAVKRKGLVYAFPSYVLHRVTPVTKGIRRTLITWLTGPKFR